MKVVKKTRKLSSSRLPTNEKRGYSIHVISDHSGFWPLDQAHTFRHLLWSLLCHPLLLLLEETNKRVHSNVACVESVFVRFRSKQQGMKTYILALVPFFGRQRPKTPFLVVYLLWNHTETLATQAKSNAIWALFVSSSPRIILAQQMILTHYPGLNLYRHLHTTNNFCENSLPSFIFKVFRGCGLHLTFFLSVPKSVFLSI